MGVTLAILTGLGVSVVSVITGIAGKSNKIAVVGGIIFIATIVAYIYVCQ